VPQIISAGVQRQYSGTAGCYRPGDPLTCNEIAARSAHLSSKPVTGTGTGGDGRPGAAASTRQTLPTTGGKKGNRERNDLRLEYHVPHVRE
jgi:hypothetical protein